MLGFPGPGVVVARCAPMADLQISIAGQWNFLAVIAQACSSVSPSTNLCWSLHQIQDVGASEVWSHPDGTSQSCHESHISPTAEWIPDLLPQFFY